MPRAPAERVRLTPIDSTTFSTIYERDFRYVWLALRRLGIPERDLPDVAHDVFVTVYKRFHTFDSSRPIRPWLFGVLFRVASDHFRRMSTQREVFDAIPDIADSRPWPDARCVEREEWRVVDRALLGLTLPHRAVLVMHDFLGYRGHEVARTLGIPLGTVYSRLEAARAHFLDLAQSANAAKRGTLELGRRLKLAM